MDRFFAKVRISDELQPGGCWEWSAGKIPDGYGVLRHDGKSRLAHRVSYERFVGKVPGGLEVDHLCRNRSCVNPSHLEAVTHRENIMRGRGICAGYAARTHCREGHALAGDNLVPSALKAGARMCLVCSRQRQRRYNEKKRELAVGCAGGTPRCR